MPEQSSQTFLCSDRAYKSTLSLDQETNNIVCVHAVPPEAELSAELKEGLELCAGATMRLQATIKGRPIPKITWAKMNTNIKDRQGIIIKSTNTDTMVMVENVNRYDAGKYILNLESLAGMKMYTIVVKVLGE